MDHKKYKKYKTFTSYPTKPLMKLVEAFHSAMYSINRGHFSVDSLVLKESKNSPTVVSTNSESRFSVNISHVEGLLDEGWRRVSSLEKPGEALMMLSSLEQEVEKALNRHILLVKDGVPTLLQRVASASSLSPKGPKP